MNLKIETMDVQKTIEINNAYNEALSTSDVNSFVRNLDGNTNENMIVGLSGSHIWISDKETGKRLAIIIL